MFLIGVLLAFLVPVFIYATQTSSLSIRTAKVQQALQAIEQSVDELEKMGGGQTYVWIDLPEGVENYTIANKTVLIKLKIGEGTSDIFFMTNNNVSGILPTAEGKHKISIEVANSTTSIDLA